MAAGVDVPVPHRLQNAAPLLLGVAAPHEAALPQIGREFRKRLRQVLLQLQIHLLRVK